MTSSCNCFITSSYCPPGSSLEETAMEVGKAVVLVLVVDVLINDRQQTPDWREMKEKGQERVKGKGSV